MAAFLLLPIFIGWGIGKKSKSTGCHLVSLASFICLILTMSRAAIIALLGTIIIYVMIKRKKSIDTERRATSLDITKLLLGGIIFVLCALLLLTIMVYFGTKLPGFDFLYRGVSDINGKANLIRSETVDIPYIVEIMLKKPFRYGFYNMLHGVGEIDTNMANALMLWLISGGVAGFLLAIFIVMRGILVYAIPAIKTNDPIMQAIAMCFIRLTIHSLSYGTWMTTDYLLIYALLIAQKNKEIV